MTMELRPPGRSLTTVPCPRCRAGVGFGCSESYGPVQTFHRERAEALDKEPAPLFGSNWEGWRVLSDAETNAIYAERRDRAEAVRAGEDEQRTGLAASREALKVHPRPLGIRADGSCSLPVGHPLVSKYLATGVLERSS